MKLLERFAPTAAPAQKPGRHSEAGIIARQQAEIVKLREAHAKEIAGYKNALQLAAKEVQGARRNTCLQQTHGAFWVHTDHPIPCPWCEIRRLGALVELLTPQPVPGDEGTSVPAAAELPGSCFNEPETAAQDRDEEQLPPIALSLPRPATYEPADPAAETQAVPQVEQTQVMPIAVVEEATGIDATQVMPIVVPRRPLEPTPAVTWGRIDPETAQIEARLNIPGPDPFASATAIPRTAIDNAVTSVRAVVTEAAS